MQAWLYLHWRAFCHAWVRLMRQPFGTFLSALVIGIALALPGAGFVLLDNMSSLARGVAGKPEVSVFLKSDASPEQRQAIEESLRQNPRIASSRFVGKDLAREELIQNGWGDVLEGLSENPLPDAYVLGLHGDVPEHFTELASTLSALPGVERVQLDSVWVRRLAALIDLGRTITLGLGVLLAIALVIVTFNTIRLMILTQRPEIEVSRLLGATDALISRPFYWLGALQGFLGGLMALAAIWAVVFLVRSPVDQLARTYDAIFAVQGPSTGLTIILIAAAVFLGWLGSVISVKRNLAVVG